MSEVHHTRFALGIYLIYSYAVLVPNLSFFFGKTLLFVGLPALLILAVLFSLGLLNRLMTFGLFLLNLVFYRTAPHIIHEPQQLLSLFLLLFVFFLPPQKGAKVDSGILKILVVALGVYYLTAGIKKMLDPLWLSGEALGYLLQWEGLGRDNGIVQFLNQHRLVVKTLNFATLAFEISFLPLLLSRAWKILLVVGAIFHLLIACTMEVGTFSAIMMVWYMTKVDLEGVSLRRFCRA